MTLQETSNKASRAENGPQNGTSKQPAHTDSSSDSDVDSDMDKTLEYQSPHRSVQHVQNSQQQTTKDTDANSQTGKHHVEGKSAEPMPADTDVNMMGDNNLRTLQRKVISIDSRTPNKDTDKQVEEDSNQNNKVISEKNANKSANNAQGGRPLRRTYEHTSDEDDDDAELIELELEATEDEELVDEEDVEMDFCDDEVWDDSHVMEPPYNPLSQPVQSTSKPAVTKEIGENSLKVDPTVMQALQCAIVLSCCILSTNSPF